jgi:hypothetical protein
VSEGSWSGLSTVSPGLSVGQSTTLFFSPARPGTHAIEYYNINTIANAGTIQFCWRSGTGAWSCWATDPVTYQKRIRILYSGSSDINYRFVITKTSNGSADFYTRFYTGW